MAIIEFREVDLEAERGAISFTHFNFLDLSVFTECIFENFDFVKYARFNFNKFNRVNSDLLAYFGITDPSDFPFSVIKRAQVYLD